MHFRGHGLARPTRREFLTGAAAIAASALLIDATEIDRHRLTLIQHTIYISNLPAAFHGFRIAQISDIHYNHYAEEWFLRETVARVNALQPDLVAITGDFITADQHSVRNNQRHESECAEILGGLTCPLRFCSLGNHDSIDFVGVQTVLESRGLQVLRNAYTSIDLHGDRLWIGGLADAYFDAPDFTRAIPRQRMGAPVLLLGHEPDIAPAVYNYSPVDLLLAGHTHGGQIRLPLLTPFFLPDMGQRYIHGRFNLNGMQLYVNRGIGTVHVPVRFRCPPEITLLMLQPGTPAPTTA